MDRLAVSILFLILAYLPSRKEQYATNVDSVLRSLLREESFQTVNTENKVALGFGSCMDYFTDGVEAMEALKLLPPEFPRHHDVISSAEDLAQAFAFHFSHGGAAERYCRNQKQFEKWAGIIRKLPSTRVKVGGNAPVMARRFAMEGWQVLLGARMAPSALQKLHPSISVPGTWSKLENDIHLIFENNIGRKWGGYTSPRANRFIIHSDYSNMMLDTLDNFVESLPSFQPSLVVVGGLQMLDNFPLDVSIRQVKLQRLQAALASLPRSTKVHFEMASFTEELLLKEIVEYVLPYADSIGMNEQELTNLCSVLEYGNITIVSDPYPRVAKALDQLRVLYKHLHARTSLGRRMLSRIHLHTLAYQAILVSKGSMWQNVNGAVAKASLTANRVVCASNDINLDNTRMIMDDSFSISVEPGSNRMPLIDSAPVSCWNEDSMRFCVAPNLVCTAVQQTAGGGDNISAAGLVLQL